MTDDDDTKTTITSTTTTIVSQAITTSTTPSIIVPIDEVTHDAMKEEQDDDDDNNDIALFDQEETELLTIYCYNDVTTTTPTNQLDIKDEIKNNNNPIILHLNQYNSNDNRWGIYSCVWDGGIALLYYMNLLIKEKQQQEQQQLMLLDLGSGTGVVGIGISLLLPHHVDIVVTDLPDAMSLLQDNIQLNHHHEQKTTTNHNNNNNTRSITAKELIWGTRDFIQDWFTNWLITSNDDNTKQRRIDNNDNLISNNNLKKRKLLYITGADIVYRPSLFNPLLSSLQDLVNYIHDDINITIEILLSCQSIRTTLNDFINEALSRKYHVQLIAIIQLPSMNNISIQNNPIYWNHIQYIQTNYIFSNDNNDNDDSSTADQNNIDMKKELSSHSTRNSIPKGPGIIWILSIRIERPNQ